MIIMFPYIYHIQTFNHHKMMIKNQLINGIHPTRSDISTYRYTKKVMNHIKKIMQKIDVHNQGALMKKLLAIAAL